MIREQPFDSRDAFTCVEFSDASPALAIGSGNGKVHLFRLDGHGGSSPLGGGGGQPRPSGLSIEPLLGTTTGPTRVGGGGGGGEGGAAGGEHAAGTTTTMNMTTMGGEGGRDGEGGGHGDTARRTMGGRRRTVVEERKEQCRLLDDIITRNVMKARARTGAGISSSQAGKQ